MRRVSATMYAGARRAPAAAALYFSTDQVLRKPLAASQRANRYNPVYTLSTV